MSLKEASAELQDDRDVVLAAVKQNGKALQFASEARRDDKEIVLAAIQQNDWAFTVASDPMRDNGEVASATFIKNGWQLENASDRIKNHKGLVRTAALVTPGALGKASDSIRADVEFVNHLVEICRTACADNYTDPTPAIKVLLHSSTIPDEQKAAILPTWNEPGRHIKAGEHEKRVETPAPPELTA